MEDKRDHVDCVHEYLYAWDYYQEVWLRYVKGALDPDQFRMLLISEGNCYKMRDRDGHWVTDANVDRYVPRFRELKGDLTGRGRPSPQEVDGVLSRSDADDLRFVEGLMEQAFPLEERPDVATLRRRLLEQPLFHCCVITMEDYAQPIGLLTYWILGADADAATGSLTGRGRPSPQSVDAPASTEITPAGWTGRGRPSLQSVDAPASTEITPAGWTGRGWPSPQSVDAPASPQENEVKAPSQEVLYVEHFAIDPALRGRGYGNVTLAHLLTQICIDRHLMDLLADAKTGITRARALKRTLPVVLEVEAPATDEARRRIAFYERNGLELWPDTGYLQPAYRAGGASVPMRLMATPNLEPSSYPEIRELLYRHVYGVSVS